MTTIEALQKTRKIVEAGEAWGLIALVPIGAQEAVDALKAQFTAGELEYQETIVNGRRIEIVDRAIQQLTLKEIGT